MVLASALSAITSGSNVAKAHGKSKQTMYRNRVRTGYATDELCIEQLKVFEGAVRPELPARECEVYQM